MPCWTGIEHRGLRVGGVKSTGNGGELHIASRIRVRRFSARVDPLLPTGGRGQLRLRADGNSGEGHRGRRQHNITLHLERSSKKTLQTLPKFYGVSIQP